MPLAKTMTTVAMDKEAASEFKRFLLYVVPTDPNSQKAVEIMNRGHDLQEDVWVQDVRLLKPPLPPWLDGVPTIVRRSSGEVYKGSACLTFLTECMQKTPTCIQGRSGNCVQGFHTGEAMPHHFEAADVDSGGPLEDRSGKVSDDQMAAMLAAREAQDQHFGPQAPQDMVSIQS